MNHSEREQYEKNEIHPQKAEAEIQQIRIFPEWLELLQKVEGAIDGLKLTLPLNEKLTNEDRLSVVQGMLISFGGYEEPISEDCDDDSED